LLKYDHEGRPQGRPFCFYSIVIPAIILHDVGRSRGLDRSSLFDPSLTDPGEYFIYSASARRLAREELERRRAGD
jgi:hypothetical protein